MIDLANPSDVRREAERRQQLRARGVRTFSDEPDSHLHTKCEDDRSRIIDPIEYELDEKAIEHECDKMAQKAGARVVRFSHPGKTRQTIGIADRLYCFPKVGRALWMEVKTPRGKQRPGQVLFEELVTACGHDYLEGGVGDLRVWLVMNRIARIEDL
jgi:hypothetical protein